jgi:tetratricopeptide (TPR) repeat protein
MKRLLILAAAALTATGCAEIRELTHRDENPYAKTPFYAKYLNTGSTLDSEIQRVLNELESNPNSPELHNALGAMLVEKGFPKDAAREFERSVDANGRYYQGWYNLGLARAGNGDALGARRALQKAVSIKPGHSAALFQLGLIEEKRLHTDRAVALFAKAYAINPALLDVSVNPRILDSGLTDLALIEMYKISHTKGSMQFQDAPVFTNLTVAPSPAGRPTLPRTDEAPSPQPDPATIVTPSAPPTDAGTQTNTPRPNRRRPRNQALEPQPQPAPTDNPALPPPQNPPGR